MFSKEREVKSDNVSMGKIETDYYWITLELEENRITLSFEIGPKHFIMLTSKAKAIISSRASSFSVI